MNEKKIELLDCQNKASIIFLSTIIVSIILTYNKKKDLLSEQILFDKETAKYINLINKIIILFLTFYFIYINVEEYKLNSKTSAVHEIEASVFNSISSLIVLYVILETWNEDSDIIIENPTL